MFDENLNFSNQKNHAHAKLYVSYQTSCFAPDLVIGSAHINNNINKGRIP